MDSSEWMASALCDILKQWCFEDPTDWVLKVEGTTLYIITEEGERYRVVVSVAI